MKKHLALTDGPRRNAGHPVRAQSCQGIGARNRGFSAGSTSAGFIPFERLCQRDAAHILSVFGHSGRRDRAHQQARGGSSGLEENEGVNSGHRIVGSTPQELATTHRKDFERWGDFIRSAAITIK